MRRFWLVFLILVTVVFGTSYASVIVNAIMGPWSATAVEHDGSLTSMQFGRDLPRPEWLPLYPNATIVQASRLTSTNGPSGFHALDLATRASLAEVRRFYVDRLSAAGFEVADLGVATLNPLTARMLGVDGMLSARRPATDDLVMVHIGTPDGLIASRTLQIRWAKLSEYPRHAEPGKL
jgi:hypothetical protein